MIDTSTLTDYSWSDIAKAAKTAMITAALGGSELIINGRTIQRISIEDATKLYQLALAMSSDNGDGTALVQFGEAV